MDDDGGTDSGADMVQDAFVAHSTQSGVKWADATFDAMYGIRRPFDLRIDGWGIAVNGAAGISAPWHDIADVYVLTMLRQRFVVYELTPEAARRMGKGKTTHAGRWHVGSQLGAVQPAVQCTFLDRDEREVLAAVEHFSGGRFPSPERVWNGPRGEDVLRRDMFKRRQPGDGGSVDGGSVSDL